MNRGLQNWIQHCLIFVVNSIKYFIHRKFGFLNMCYYADFSGNFEIKTYGKVNGHNIKRMYVYYRQS
jgi:hypothetical protein